MAGKLANYMCHNLKDVIADVSTQGSPEAAIKGLHMEMDKRQRHHQKEIDKVKHNANLTVTEMHQSMGAEKQRGLMDARVQSEINQGADHPGNKNEAVVRGVRTGGNL